MPVATHLVVVMSDDTVISSLDGYCKPLTDGDGVEKIPLKISPKRRFAVFAELCASSWELLYVICGADYVFAASLASSFHRRSVFLNFDLYDRRDRHSTARLGCCIVSHCIVVSDVALVLWSRCASVCCR